METEEIETPFNTVAIRDQSWAHEHLDTLIGVEQDLETFHGREIVSENDHIVVFVPHCLHGLAEILLSLLKVIFCNFEILVDELCILLGAISPITAVVKSHFYQKGYVVLKVVFLGKALGERVFFDEGNSFEFYNLHLVAIFLELLIIQIYFSYNFKFYGTMELLKLNHQKPGNRLLVSLGGPHQNKLVIKKFHIVQIVVIEVEFTIIHNQFFTYFHAQTHGQMER